MKLVIGLNLTKGFNDITSMNIKEQINDHKILYIIDHAKCFCSATIVESKYKEEIVGAISQHWIALFGK